jgi:hypothetical protein
MKTSFAPYALRSFRPKRASSADNGYTATLARGPIAVAQINCGTAPGNDILVVNFVSEAEQAFFQAHAARITTALKNMPADERFLRDLAEATHQSSCLAKLCKTRTVFRTAADPPGRWRQVRAPFRPALALALQRRFPAPLEFANERFATAS